MGHCIYLYFEPEVVNHSRRISRYFILLRCWGDDGKVGFQVERETEKYSFHPL